MVIGVPQTARTITNIEERALSTFQAKTLLTGS